jgi:putative oxidoreductase
MNTTTFRINWDLVSRLFIGALFIFAGVDKLRTFESTGGYIDSVLGTGAMTPVVTGLTIFIEIVVAAVYIWGKYKRDTCAYILIAFTALATVLFHNNFQIPLNVIMSLKNLAIIGGIIATLGAVHSKRTH